MKDPTIVLSRPGPVQSLRLELPGPLARTVHIEPKPTTFNAAQIGAIDPEQRPVTWNRVLLLLGAPIVRRGRWGRP